MSSDKFFRGTYTALVTPFRKGQHSTADKFVDPDIDFDAYRSLVQRQIEAKVDGIVPIGTTGESPSIEFAEEEELIRIAVEMCKGTGIKVVPGTGSNWTKTAVESSQIAERLGADGFLVVNPYYNKPTQTGLFEYFTTVASYVTKPILLYNIMPRTNVNVETETLVEIVRHAPNIQGVKEASGKTVQINEVIGNVGKALPADFSVMSGDDGLTDFVVANGGDGVVSVISNVCPADVVAYVNTLLSCRQSSNYEASDRIKARLKPLIEAAFIQTNPIPVKFMLAEMCLLQEVYRSPMTKLDEAVKSVNGAPEWRHPRQEVRNAMVQYGLITK